MTKCDQSPTDAVFANLSQDKTVEKYLLRLTGVPILKYKKDLTAQSLVRQQDSLEHSLL